MAAEVGKYRARYFNRLQFRRLQEPLGNTFLRLRGGSDRAYHDGWRMETANSHRRIYHGNNNKDGDVEDEAPE